MRVEVSLRSILTVVAVAFGAWLVIRVWQILLLVLVALVLAGTLAPAVDWLEQRRFRRPMAVATVALGLAICLVGLGAVVVPALVDQMAALATSTPS